MRFSYDLKSKANLTLLLSLVLLVSMLIGDWKPPVTHKSSTQLFPFFDQSTGGAMYEVVAGVTVGVTVPVSFGGVAGGLMGGAVGGVAVTGVVGGIIP